MGKLQDKVCAGKRLQLGYRTAGVAIRLRSRRRKRSIRQLSRRGPRAQKTPPRSGPKSKGWARRRLDVRGPTSSIEHEAEKLVETVAAEFRTASTSWSKQPPVSAIVARVEAMGAEPVGPDESRSYLPQRLSVHALRAADHVPAGLWQDHQHRPRRLAYKGSAGLGALLRGQGRDHRVPPGSLLARDRHEQHYR